MTELQDHNTRIIDEFHANRGVVGGRYEGVPVLLLHTVGARSGEPRTNPVVYLPDEQGRHLVFGSYAGADKSPAWYYNLLANPDVRIEVGDETLAVHAVELKGEERDRYYAEQARRVPTFAGYQEKTDRLIPVIALVSGK